MASRTTERSGRGTSCQGVSPTSGVLSFDYKTTVNGSTSRDEIANNAIFLLELLHFDRETDEAAAARPSSSLAIMFFATPHKGMSSSSWLAFTSALLQLSTQSPVVPPTKKMLKDLALNTDTLLRSRMNSGLSRTNLGLRTLLRGRDGRIRKEARPRCTLPSTQVKTHGLKNGAYQLVDENHGLMNAPKKKEMVMKEGMEFLIKQSPKAIDQMDRDARRAFHSLCPTGFYDYSAAKERGEGGCEWISEPQELQDWLDDEADKQMLWIQGTGKVVSYCHLGDSVPERGGTCIPVLSRATLYHALRYEPELAYEILVPAFFEAEGNEKMIGHVRDDDIWTAERLAPMWPNALAIVLSFRPPTLVVDGLNQMGIGCQQGFLDCIAACKAKAGPEYMGRLRVLLLPSEGQEKEESQEKPLFRYYIGDT
ncbi:hypothetical protein B0H63DRAFT_530065 [Podospora didyma]|uniref:Nephrocystin 3-like N-terminal domain-containing protein n=1 Tax=Podospora didyma TaxID=330526 RepID=A0AAE0JVW0_9PEZI|nr:hypothetical protein B0H63DRAFT_530065 [Podospora didyma]